MTAALRLEVRRSRALVIWIACIAVAYGATIAIFWPIMRDNSALLTQYMAVFPKGFLAAFGMEGSLADPGVFFATYVGSWLWPVLSAVAAVVLATRPVAVDLERGFLELALSTPFSRLRYLLTAVGVQAVAMAALAFVTVFGFTAAATVAGAPYDMARMLLVAVLAWAFGCAIAGVTSLLSVITLSRGVTAGIVMAVLLAMYLADIVSKMQPDLAGLDYLSAMHYFRAIPIVDEGTVPLAETSLFAVAAAAGWGLAVLLFRRRDLAA